MKNELYDYCYKQYISKSSNWAQTWKKFGGEKIAPHPDALRKRFQRERIARGDPSVDDVERGASHPPDVRADYEFREWDTGRIDNPEDNVKSTYTQKEDELHVVCDSRRLRTPDDIIKYFDVDMNVWKLSDFSIGSSEGYRKDRKVSWVIKNGTVLDGEVEDSGKMLVVPLVNVKAFFKKKTTDDFWDEGNIRKLYERIWEDTPLPDPSPRMPKEESSGYEAVLPIADVHLGLLSTHSVNGEDYNLNIAESRIDFYIDFVLNKLSGKKLDKIHFVVGNDYLNTDNLHNTTEKGTPQDTSAFWFDIMETGVKSIRKNVEKLEKLAPVKIWNVPSNHDMHSMWSIMNILAGWYSTNDNVEIDISAFPRKYIKIGKSLCGFTHDMKVSDAESHLLEEGRDFLGECDQYYWFLAHLHRAMIYESMGKVTVQRLPTFSAQSRWGTKFVRAPRMGQAFLFNGESGLEDTYNVHFK